MAFTIAPDSDGQARALRCKPVHARQRLLHFISQNVAAHQEGHAIDELTMRLVGHLDARITGPGVIAVDQRRRQHLATGSGQVLAHAELLGKLVRVGKRHHTRQRLALGLEQQAFRGNPIQNRPAHRMADVGRSGGDMLTCSRCLVASTTYSNLVVSYA